MSKTHNGVRCALKGWNLPVAGLWDYDGACKPNPVTEQPVLGGSWQTFSVGVFQWVAKSRGTGVKRGKVVKRISGPVSDPASVYAKAEAFCVEKEKQESTH